MPIGVPRIIYSWGEELPAQWTDIYNFIFRRRMVFLMQYLDDELCNQICGLLINIHMEDRSKELEKKETERSGLFKAQNNTTQNSKSSASDEAGEKTSNFFSKKIKSAEDLLKSDEDLGIEENNTLEQYTLQKITMEWLNWNAQFFDYSEEPYLFYLAELFNKKNLRENDARLLYNVNTIDMSKLMLMLKNMANTNLKNSLYNELGETTSSSLKFLGSTESNNRNYGLKNFDFYTEKRRFDVYSPFRLLANFTPENYSLKDLNPLSGKNQLLQMFAQIQKLKFSGLTSDPVNEKLWFSNINKLVSNLAQKDFSSKIQNTQYKEESSIKALAQRSLRNEYIQDRIQRNNGALIGSTDFLNKKSNINNIGHLNKGALNYLDFESYDQSYNEFKDYYRKQTERAFQEEESKKVFVIINSFGGSVGNGITVHDALQFIKAGSLTLALGVAASAASLALAGGTIGERYVTEGCHVMIHQPEGGLQGQASDIWIDSQEIMKIRLDVAEIYSLSTYRPRHKILRDLDRDFYLTATETIHYGLADEIATNEVMHEIIEMTSKVWDYHDSKQQRLLESRESASAGLDTQTQN
uniref:ATP-dependent Clp protease proteolytic subunit n=1 Tax=Borodinellopsis insignis TaxID=3229915 RepID=A0AB39U3R9_9CHLO